MPLLPTTKTRPKPDLADLTVLAYGQTKIGKTTLCSQADGALFLATDPGSTPWMFIRYPFSPGRNYVKHARR